MTLRTLQVLLSLYLLVPQYEALFDSRLVSSALHQYWPSLHDTFSGQGDRESKGQRIRVHLEHDETIVVPKHATVKYLHPLEVSAEEELVFPPVNGIHLPRDLPPITVYPDKKPKYVRPIYDLGKLTSGGPEAPGDVKSDEKERAIALEELIQALSVAMPLDHGLFIPAVPITQHQQIYGRPQDFKPVTEHIEHDLKYDFRTKTHSV